jgi:hypothetical protein
MRTLIYWVADCMTDSHAYSIRGKTRRDVTALRALATKVTDYDKPRKVTVKFEDAFDLVRQALGEGGIE